MNLIEQVCARFADLLWGDWLMAALVGMGIYYTFLTGFIQFRTWKMIMSGRLKSGAQAAAEDRGTVSSWQALCVALASCVGSGNIVGVSTAILAGGPGALFWMWVAAFFGMATKFAEVVLGLRYHGIDEHGEIIGGPMYYISRALRWRHAGFLAALLLFIQNCGATLIQSNTFANVASVAFGGTPIITGILLAVLMSVIISGGFRRLVQVAQRVVPLMAGLYLLGGIAVLLTHLSNVIPALGAVFRSAFSVRAGTGALGGLSMKQAMRYGVARGLYSNEAGEGSAAVIHSGAQVDHPVRQGMYGVIEVFADTFVICSTSAFSILLTGVHLEYDNAITLTAQAFQQVFQGLGALVYLCLLLFSGTSIMSQWYFGHVSLVYLRKSSLARLYRMLFPVLIVIGSISTVRLVWSVQDIALAFLVLPNLLALAILSPEVRRLTAEFFERK